MPQIPLVPSPLDPMDPNLFALKWDQVFEVLMAVVLLSLVIERALSLLFESKFFLDIETRRDKAGKGSFKPLIAFVVAATACVMWKFDALSVMFSRGAVTYLGCVITGAVVAGGSKGSLKLFRDVLGIYSTSYAEAKGLLKPGAQQAPPVPAPAPAPAPSDAAKG